MFKLSLQDVLGVQPTKVPISFVSFVSYMLPPLALYMVTAFLAILPRTRALRIALCPIVALLALRAAFSVDHSLGVLEEKSKDFNMVALMVTLAVQSLCWTFAEKPLIRYLRPANSSPSTIMDVIDLASSSRGIGWDWSRGLYVPRDTRPTDRLAFALHTFLSAVVQGFICDLLQEAIKTFVTSTGSTFHETTIFDESLPFFIRYLRSSILTILVGAATHTGVQSVYNLPISAAVLLLGYDRAQWPPLFDNPWGATSLTDFWGRRWHQLYRRGFLFASYPLTATFGRPGTVIGAFLISALIHHFILLPLDDQTEMWRMLVGFGMMAPGILAERASYRLTGKKVGGFVGWVWTMTWLLLWGHFIADGFVRGGMFACPSFPVGKQLGVRVLVARLVANFDAWLHTI